MDPNNQQNQEVETFNEISASKESVESTEPPNVSATTSDFPEFGWSAYAERINGRFAMIGFTAVLLIEFLSNDAFLRWAGLIN